MRGMAGTPKPSVNSQVLYLATGEDRPEKAIDEVER